MTTIRRAFRRLLVPAAATLVAGAWVGVGATSAAATSSGDHAPSPCVNFTQDHQHAVFGYTFDARSGEATVTVKDGKKLCADVPVTLVSYVKPAKSFGPQYVFDAATKVLGKDTPSVALKVSVPSCAGQVDLFFGGTTDIRNPLTNDNLYGSLILGDAKSPGSTAKATDKSGRAGVQLPGAECVVNPGATFTDTCNGVSIALGTGDKLPSNLATTVKVYRNGAEIDSVPLPAGSGPVVRTYPAKAGDRFAVKYRDRTGAQADLGAHTYAQPANCTPPTTPPATPTAVASSAQGSTLPVTGGSLALLIVVAVVLIGGGTAALVLSRRRKETPAEQPSEEPSES